MVHGSWCCDAWFMVHGAWILVPRSSWSCCNDHLVPGSWCNTLSSACIGSWCPGSGIRVPWCMVHEPIPWVLVALDPGTWCPGSGIMDHAPWYILRSSEQESFLTQSTTGKSLQNNQERRTPQPNTTGIVQVKCSGSVSSHH